MRHTTRITTSLSIASLAASAAMAQVRDLDSPASSANLVDSGFNHTLLKDGNGGWYTAADPTTGLFPFLEAGSCFMGLKGTVAGSTTGALGIYMYGQDGIEHFNPANNRACWWNAKNYATASGTWVLTTASSTPTYRVQTGDRAGVLYHAPIKLKGTPVNAMPCFGDIDSSMEVDNGDVAFALLDYGPCPGCMADLDGTGEVDFGDVALILLGTGPCQ